MENVKIPVSKSLSNLILFELAFPTLLLVFGIYHGLMQVLYRAGIIRSSSVLGIEYYQGLTLHGVINAIVFTTFFAVAFGNALIPYYLKRTMNLKVAWTSLWVMALGTLVTAAPIFAGKASVLYTFYPPLKAHPLFYIGASTLIVGSWVSFFNWISPYRAWRKANPKQKTPMGVLGIFATFIVWFIATVPVAFEVLVLLLPWSLGWTHDVNVVLARTLFWFFGHPLVYFWLLPAYTMYYVMLPKVAGGKLYSDFAGRFGFLMFIVFSAPVGLHHQFADPGINSTWKAVHTVLTFVVSLPSFITAFTLAASLEYAAKKRGGRGLFSWWAHLPYGDKENYLFSYLFCGLVLFIFGGITGLVNASYVLNSLVHNTSWLPGHFHMTVAGPVFLGFIAMSLWISTHLLGKEVKFKALNLSVPYLWTLGILVFSTGLSWGGLIGEPRRTNLGLTYLNPASPQFHPAWQITTLLGAIGGSIMALSMLIYFVVFFASLFSKKVGNSVLEFPTSECFHDEDVPAVQSFRPWLIAAGVALVLAYGPPLYEITKNPAAGAVPFDPESPLPALIQANHP